jgi:glycerol uptake facilitator-like aquaporin
MVVSGRMTIRRLPVYFIAQFAGAILAGLALYVLFAPSIAAYEHAHGIVRGAPESVKTAMMFGEFYPPPALGTGVVLRHDPGVYPFFYLEYLHVIIYFLYSTGNRNIP